MKKVYLQHWEESERGWGVRPDGCSLHIDLENHKSYLQSIYDERDPMNVPHEYERIVGDVSEVLVSDTIFSQIIKTKGTLRLMQHSFSNLIKLQEINLLIDNESFN